MLAADVLKLDGEAWIEIAAAFAAYFLLSFLWWGPVFGKLWAREKGFDTDERPDGRTMGKAMILQAISTFLIAFVFWHVTMAFTVELETGAMSQPSVAMALQGAVWTWLGFFLPLNLGAVAWERASWTLLAINTGGHLLGLLAMGLMFGLL